jgi:hypothetical protein
MLGKGCDAVLVTSRNSGEPVFLIRERHFSEIFIGPATCSVLVARIGWLLDLSKMTADPIRGCSHLQNLIVAEHSHTPGDRMRCITRTISKRAPLA